MKLYKYWFFALFSTVMLFATSSEAHDWPVHVQITKSACSSSTGLSLFLSNNLSSPALFGSPRQMRGTFTPIVWIEQGSKMEDEETYFSKTVRPLDHFYTVTPNRIRGEAPGISDNTEGPLIQEDTGIGIHTVGAFVTNSFVWASADGVEGPALLGIDDNPALNVGANLYNWQRARAYEYAALTNASSANRDMYMALMYYSLGHVLHLNQDLSQPDHVRNDNHNFTDKRFIENFGVKNFKSNPQWFALQPHGWAYWQAGGFSQLRDFWDRGLYTGNARALNDDANSLSGKQLGLAEFSNGNFLGEDALYTEVVPASDVFHHFPYPSLISSTQYRSSWNHPLATIDNSVLTDGSSVKRVYLNKIADGISLTHHSVMGYLDVMSMTSPASVQISRRLFTPSINDSNVLQDYHSFLIPKAIEYSAGILDYFFRGAIEGRVVGFDTNLMQYTNSIVNNSSQDFVGGVFSLYEDNSDSVRTLLAQTNLLGTLPTGGSTMMTFPSPTSPTDRLILIYRGNIGEQEDAENADDPIDQGRAIAVQPQFLCSTPDCWISTLKSATNGTPAYTVDSLSITGETNRLAAVSNACINVDNGIFYFYEDENACNCVAQNYTELYSVQPISASQVLCDYSAALSFKTVTLHPTQPWIGSQFTLHIDSGDSRISISPNTVTITTNFYSDITLTLTQSGSFTATTVGNLSGDCVPPTDGSWDPNMTPILHAEP